MNPVTQGLTIHAAEGLYYSWSKEFLEAGKRRLAGDTGRQATSGEVKDLKRERRGD
jgi:transposase